MPESYSWRKYKRQIPYHVTGIVFILRVDPVMSIKCVGYVKYITSVTYVISHSFVLKEPDTGLVSRAKLFSRRLLASNLTKK